MTESTTIKAIIFDFDGVITESVDIKTQGFAELFRDYPQHLPVIRAYHLRNGGISRRVKIQYIYEQVLKKPLSAADLDRLCDRYSSLVVERVIAAPYVKGAAELLAWAKGRYKMFVVSGTPQVEMRAIVERRGMKFFEEVYGSPTSKAEIVRIILKEQKLQPSEAIFLGDSVNDLDAAKETGVPFIARTSIETEDWLTKDPYVAVAFEDLQPVDKYLATLIK